VHGPLDPAVGAMRKDAAAYLRIMETKDGCLLRTSENKRRPQYIGNKKLKRRKDNETKKSTKATKEH